MMKSGSMEAGGFDDGWWLEARFDASHPRSLLVS